MQRNHSAKTTLILDDSPLKVHLQPYNHLCLKEYDIQMRKHDVSVRRLEMARERSSDKISGNSFEEMFCQKEAHDLTKESPEDPTLTKEFPEDPALTKEFPEDPALSAGANDSPELVSGAGNTKARKRRRRGKKDREKKKRIDQPTQKLEEQDPLPYDETLLAVIGILDAAKRETNVAAWMRSGGLIQLPMEQDHSEDETEPDETIESLKKMEMSGDENEDGMFLAGSKQVSLLSLEIPSPGEAGRCTEIMTEPSRVQVDEPSPGKRVEGEDDVEHQLWFNYPAIKAFWVSRGRKALKELEIDILSGVIGPIG